MNPVILANEDALSILSLLWGCEDRGPKGEGWKSDELLRLIATLEDALDIPPDDCWEAARTGARAVRARRAIRQAARNTQEPPPRP
jgi:hypothetical protein